MRASSHIAKIVTAAVFAVALVAVLAYAELTVPKDTRGQAEASIKASVLDASVQCFAVEGAYPVSLAHLEHNYGLVVNHNRYIVTYTCFASNVMPRVEVFSRDDAQE